MFGYCPCCKEWKSLTKHHDKMINKVILICRDCHNTVEEYVKVQKKADQHEDDV